MKPIKCSNCNSNDMERHEFFWECNSCLTKHELNQPIVKEVIREVGGPRFYGGSAMIIPSMVTSSMAIEWG